MPRLRTLFARPFGLALVALALAPSPTSALADLTISVLSSAAPVGGSGSFDALLSNSGTASFQVSGFSVELTVATGSGVKFTAASVATTAAPYLFGTFQSPPPFSNITSPTTDFIASNTSFTPPNYYIVVAPGASFGLEHVTDSVAPGTAIGPITVTVADLGGGTSLSDVNGNAISFAATNGTIAPFSVPEPTSIGLMSAAMASVALTALARQKRLGSRAGVNPIG